MASSSDKKEAAAAKEAPVAKKEAPPAKEATASKEAPAAKETSAAKAAPAKSEGGHGAADAHPAPAAKPSALKLKLQALKERVQGKMHGLFGGMNLKDYFKSLPKILMTEGRELALLIPRQFWGGGIYMRLSIIGFLLSGVGLVATTPALVLVVGHRSAGRLPASVQSHQAKDSKEHVPETQLNPVLYFGKIRFETHEGAAELEGFAECAHQGSVTELKDRLKEEPELIKEALSHAERLDKDELAHRIQVVLPGVKRVYLTRVTLLQH